MNPEITLGAIFVDARHLSQIRDAYQPLNPTQPGNDTVPQPGDVIVIRRITVTDLFDQTLGNWHEEYWLATRQEFDDRFDIVDDETRTLSFAQITLKQ